MDAASKGDIMFYAFEFQDGTNTTTDFDGRVRIAGNLYRFPSRELRDLWVEEGCHYRNSSRPFRRLVKTRELPHGWKTSDAEDGVDLELVVAIEKKMEQMNDSWLEPCGSSEYGGHWAYADHPMKADEFRQRLRNADAKEIRSLEKEERESVNANINEAKSLVRRALVTISGYEAEEHLDEAKRLWGVYGDADPLWEVAEMILGEEV